MADLAIWKDRIATSVKRLHHRTGIPGAHHEKALPSAPSEPRDQCYPFCLFVSRKTVSWRDWQEGYRQLHNCLGVLVEKQS